MIVELEQAKLRLRFDHDIEDEDLQLMIDGAEQAVLNYLNLPYDYYDEADSDSSDTRIAPAVVVNATLLLIGILSNNRNGEDMEKWQQGYLPFPVIALLYPLRSPALA